MKRRPFSLFPAYLTLSLYVASSCAAAEPAPPIVSAFNVYTHGIELRLAQQHRSRITFLARHNETGERRGEFTIEQLTPSSSGALPGALLHHWRGTAFAPGATAAEFEQLMKDFTAYPQYFSPQVLQAKVLTLHGDHLQAWMRVRQRHILTVVMDTTYDITYAHLGGQHGYSASQSTRISEIDNPGTINERVLSSSEEHGFLWRQNTYWSYEERDGGLYMQIESVSLTRSIPRGLGWVVRPFVESIPRESLEFTLRSTCNALRK
ncbi:hypothetical protein [Terriglobus saanensis]|uniref:DUF3108 domain-containing protein n=1 Tax=Terriglobus saanensis (strain ATCC BAA-1853 / DSM 23119 / SP1PR4) TaxID=401053 RepID=E8V2L8_TERSS|nr:hypothetical protein [Terriglobus saanensis]ADV83493.1 hypothetical protein AciPR4_2719 [Terriglobus saanensis SP1PR4]